MRHNSISIAILVFSTASSILFTVQAAKILSVFGYPGPSHYIYISPLLKALAERGHEVTSISTFPQKEALKNFRDIYVMENSQLFESGLSGLTEGPKKSLFVELVELAEIGEVMVSNVLDNAQVKAIMETESFDLIIVEMLTSEALAGLGEFFKAPMLAVSTFGTASFIDYLVGNPSPLSYIPHMALPYGNHMTLVERIGNVLTHAVDRLCFTYMMLPYQEKVYRKYFPSATMTLNEARQNVSLVLLNDHFSLRSPRPYVPNMIEVGGLHIKQQHDLLPEDLQTFLDEATEGAIYFSLGSNVRSKDLPMDKLKAILDAFRELKLKVLWKFESDELPNKPENVIIKKWYPQPSVLAHPNIKLFITHAGFLSTTETIFHGKPILGIPVVADQFMNVENAVKAGYALALKLDEITKDSLRESILELWTNPQYTNAVQRLSKYFRDQPMTPLDKAIYWTEYVLRHEGAVHLRNAGQDLNFMEYHNIDVYAILIGGLLAIVALIVKFSCLLKKMFGSKMSKKSNGRKHKSH